MGARSTLETLLSIDRSVLFIVGAAVFLGAVVQGTVGFGVNLLAAPTVVLLEPSLMPVALLVVGIILPLVSWWNEREHVDEEVPWALAGRVAGTIPGVWLVSLLRPDQLGIAIAILILLTVALTVFRVEVQVNRSTLVGAGFVSAIAGTTAGIGGPSLGIVYQRSAPSTARATTSVVLLVGSLMSLAGLAIAGRVEARQLWTGLALIPFVVTGFVAALHVRGRFQGPSFRNVVLAAVVLSAVAVLARPLLAPMI